MDHHIAFSIEFSPSLTQEEKAHLEVAAREEILPGAICQHGQIPESIEVTHPITGSWAATIKIDIQDGPLPVTFN